MSAYGPPPAGAVFDNSGCRSLLSCRGRDCDVCAQAASDRLPGALQSGQQGSSVLVPTGGPTYFVNRNHSGTWPLTQVGRVAGDMAVGWGRRVTRRWVGGPTQSAP
jgi:hypothetical protein